MQLTVGEIAGAIGGRLTGAGEQIVTSWHTDSRRVLPGGAFFALRGAAADGHRYLAEAAARGAVLAIVERASDLRGLATIQVADAWGALYALAAEVLRRVHPVVVGITGSNGKTSTKELCAAALSVRYDVHRTAGNLNTETGVPMTVLELEPRHQVAVLEMGMQGPGEIARLAVLARPSIGVVTSIGSVHAEAFADGKDGIARAKGELLASLPGSGLAVINGDDDYADVLAARSPAPVARYGLDEASAELTLVGREVCQVVAGGIGFRVRGVPVRLALEGRHQARNALASLTVARRLGVGLAEAAPALVTVTAKHRLQRRRLAAGWTLVDDTYNASPESMLAAFETVRGMAREGRLLALLGEMRELGTVAAPAHQEIGAVARELFDEVAVVDTGWGSALARAAGADLVPDRTAAQTWLDAHARPGDLVLVKASRGVALDQLTDALR